MISAVAYIATDIYPVSGPHHARSVQPDGWFIKIAASYTGVGYSVVENQLLAFIVKRYPTARLESAGIYFDNEADAREMHAMFKHPSHLPIRIYFVRP